jgi:hypothetical protein
MKIEDANEEVAFGANKNGYDVVKLTRYTNKDDLEPEHKKELLTDEQWQKVIDAVDEAIKKLEI